MTNIELLQELIDTAAVDLKEQERQLAAVHGGITITKQHIVKLIAKKRSLEEQEKTKEGASAKSRKKNK